MHGTSSRRSQAERLARMDRVAAHAGPIAAGMLTRDEWAQQAIAVADRERLLRDAGLLQSSPDTSVRERLRAALRWARSNWQPAPPPQSASDPG